MKYFPMFRGKQNELLAVKDLAANIVRNGNVIPILEPVNANSTTKRSIDSFVNDTMQFLLICNPIRGNFVGNREELFAEVITQDVIAYGDWLPAWYLDEATSLQAFTWFVRKFPDRPLALIYRGKPNQSVCTSIKAADIQYHVFLDGRVERNYIKSILKRKRVILGDFFHRQVRNAQYPPLEFFTDLNTANGNPSDENFGDFSIVGDHFTSTGGPAHAVALHHIHFRGQSHALWISHFKSDRIHAAVDTPGKTIEAINNLVKGLRTCKPNNTSACDEYRELSRSQRFPGLGYMKRLAIKHHLEVALSKKGLGS